MSKIIAALTEQRDAAQMALDLETVKRDQYEQYSQMWEHHNAMRLYYDGQVGALNFAIRMAEIYEDTSNA